MRIGRTTRLAAAIAFAVGGIGHATATPYVGMSPNGRILAETTAFTGSGIISFGALRFDPRQHVPGERAAYRTAADGRGLRFVQFNQAIEGDWLESLKAAGLRPLQYYPDNTYLVWADGSAAESIAGWPQLRWQGEYLPEWKLSPDLAKQEGVIRNVDVFFYNDGDLAGTLEALRLAGAKVLNHGPAQPDKAFFDAWIEIDAVRLAELSQLPQVVWLEYASPKPILDDEMSDQILARNYSAGNVPQLGYLPWLAEQFTYTGLGVNWAVIDSGVDLTHPDLSSRIIGGFTYPGCPAGNGPGDDNASGGHGTHVAGIIAGTAAAGFTDAAGFKYGQGVASGAGIFAQNPICVGSTPWPPTGGWQVLSRHALAGGAVGGNGSWTSGESGGTTYTAAARTWDQIARDGNFDTPTAEPFIMVFSAGNSGPNPGTLTAPKAAKNPIVTASSRNYRVAALATTIDTISGFSSRGPTNDGRFGPTITAPGESIASSRRIAGGADCATAIAGTSNTYALCSGTSMASPHAAGSAVLLTQWWRTRNAGATPSPAMIKALLINGAKPMGATTIPNSDVGWGRIDLPGSAGLDQASSASVYVDQSALLTSVGQVWEATYGVVDTSKPLKISLAWTDAAAATGANPALVNNLDLEVVTNGQTYLGNVIAANVSTTGGTADSKNNTEGVIIANPGGSVTVRVKATNLPGDAVPGNGLLTDQDFALVCRNCADVPGFTLDATPSLPQSVCAPADMNYTIQVGAVLGYATPVMLSVTGVPAGATSNFTVNPVVPWSGGGFEGIDDDPVATAPARLPPPPGGSGLVISTSGIAAPGQATLTITGSNPDRTIDLTRLLTIATATPAVPVLATPANLSVGNSTTPTLTWSAVPNAALYRVQVSTDINFLTSVIDTTLTGTSFTVPSGTPLANATTYYWRISASNACGEGTASPVFQFRTVTAPGQCDVGQTLTTVFSENFTAGAGGFTTTGGTGTSWALSTARPSPGSGGNAMKSAPNTTTSDQWLTSSAITLPNGQLPQTLGFLNWRFLEINGSAACYDGGFLEISVNGGAFAPIASSKLLNDPYTGPAPGGQPAWCSAAAVNYTTTGTLVDLGEWAGNSVRLRWRVTTDSSVAREGWYVDDVMVTTCAGDPIFLDGFDSN